MVLQCGEIYIVFSEEAFKAPCLFMDQYIGVEVLSEIRIENGNM